MKKDFYDGLTPDYDWKPKDKVFLADNQEFKSIDDNIASNENDIITKTDNSIGSENLASEIVNPETEIIGEEIEKKASSSTDESKNSISPQENKPKPPPTETTNSKGGNSSVEKVKVSLPLNKFWNYFWAICWILTVAIEVIFFIIVWSRTSLVQRFSTLSTFIFLLFTFALLLSILYMVFSHFYFKKRKIFHLSLVRLMLLLMLVVLGATFTAIYAAASILRQSTLSGTLNQWEIGFVTFIMVSLGLEILFVIFMLYFPELSYLRKLKKQHKKLKKVEEASQHN